jgi:hypothetical protein
MKESFDGLFTIDGVQLNEIREIPHGCKIVIAALGEFEGV